MKISRFAVNIFKRILQRSDAQRLRMQKPKLPLMDKRLNIPYMDDDSSSHRFDILYATKKRKNICVIDIHGGSYVMGHRRNNHYFGSKFLEAGFDFVSIDYQVNNGDRGVENLISDCNIAIHYFFEHKQEYNLQDDIFFLTGDSAGGHLALFLTLLNDSEKVRKATGMDFAPLPIRATLANCPVYLFDTIMEDSGLTTSGAKRLFGPQYSKDEEYRKKYSPSTYFEEFKSPLFLSTCKFDFLRKHSVSMNEDLKSIHYEKLMFIDINSNNRKIGHVHNILEPDLPESQIVNQAMIDFINSLA